LKFQMQIGHLFPLFIRLKKYSHNQIPTKNSEIHKRCNQQLKKTFRNNFKNSSKKTNRLEYKINIKYKTKLSCTKVLKIRGHNA
jgi:hypothetical protein